MEPFWIFNGIIQVVYIAIIWLIGLKIMVKYFVLRERSFLLVGIVWIGMALPWFATAISFLYTLTTGNILSIQIFLLIGISFTPIVIFLWFVVVSDFLFKDKQRMTLAIVGIYGILFEILFLFLLFTQPSLLGEMKPPWRVEYRLILQIWLLSLLVIALITGVILGRESLKSESPDVRLKGKFLILAFITFFIGGLLDVIVTYEIYLIILKRSVLILASIEFYCGFILPKWIKKIFLQQM